MTFPIFLAVLFAALLHASWNAVIKFGDDKVQGMFVMSTAQGLMGVVMALGFAWPRGEVWLWLAASTLLHSSYKLFLTFAYERGDLSRVYPIARGTAPMLVALVGVFVLSDEVAATEYAGIALVGLGIFLMARGVFSSGESRRLLPFAFASALATAGYSLVDGMGARVAPNVTAFVAWMFILDGLMFGAWAILHRGRSIMPGNRRSWLFGSYAGAASFGAYWIAVQAMAVAPIALVSALRETSVLFAVLIGVVFLGERADRGKMIAAALVVAGIVLTRIGG
jgi:drug/metabolite transporter (DMT)-like permease